MPSGGIGSGVFLHHRQGLRRKKIIMKISLDFPKNVLPNFRPNSHVIYNWRSAKQQVLKHFFLTGENEMVKSVFSQVHGSVSFTVNITTSLINVVHINKIYILTLYSGYFGQYDYKNMC